MISDFLVTDLKNCCKQYSSLSYFRRNLTTEIILYTVIKNNELNNVCGFEELFNEICPRFGSRNTVKQIVETGIVKKFLIKKENITDKRILNIRPTDLTSNEFIMWQREYILSLSKFSDYIKTIKINNFK